MANCPLYNGTNLDYTGNKYNNPYTLIQKAGKRKSSKGKRSKGKKSRRYKRKNATRKRNVF